MFVKIYRWDTPQSVLESDSGGEYLEAILQPSECEVTETLNGEYSCSLKYPINPDDIRWKSLTNGNFVRVPNYTKYGIPQLFYITQYTCNYSVKNAIVSATADAVFYKLGNVMIGGRGDVDITQASEPISATTSSQFLDGALELINGRSKYSWHRFDTTMSKARDVNFPNDYVESGTVGVYSGESVVSILLGNQQNDYAKCCPLGIVERSNFNLSLSNFASARLPGREAQINACTIGTLRLGTELASIQIKYDDANLITDLHMYAEFKSEIGGQEDETIYVYGAAKLTDGELSERHLAEQTPAYLVITDLTQEQKYQLSTSFAQETAGRAGAMLADYKSALFSQKAAASTAFSLGIAPIKLQFEPIVGYYLNLEAKRYNISELVQITGTTFDACKGCYTSIEVGAASHSITAPKR